jgi:hypothetical protein
MKIVAIQTNGEGRPCAWGAAELSDPNAKQAAKAEATRQWDAHQCYPGERKGEWILHIVEGVEEK